jgi:phosphoribosylformylglycinamidine cyclo-ligase
MYDGEEYDLAGTIVGIVERDDIIDGTSIKTGYRLLGLPSTGLQTNGYSLARKVLIENGPGLEHKLSDSRTVGEALLAIHRSYLKPVTALQDAGVKIAGLSHITGGGIHGNTKRILPEGLRLDLRKNSWPVPEIFQLIQSLGNIADEEMLRAFNLGIGLIIVLSPEEYDAACQLLEQQGEVYHEIGEVV